MIMMLSLTSALLSSDQTNIVSRKRSACCLIPRPGRFRRKFNFFCHPFQTIHEKVYLLVPFKIQFMKKVQLFVVFNSVHEKVQLFLSSSIQFTKKSIFSSLFQIQFLRIHDKARILSRILEKFNNYQYTNLMAKDLKNSSSGSCHLKVFGNFLLRNYVLCQCQLYDCTYR